MEASLKDITHAAKSKGKESTSGEMEAVTMVNGMITRSVAVEDMSGLTEGTLKEIGAMVTWTVREYIHGLMDENTKESTKTIGSMGSASINGQMVDSTKECGQMGANTVKVPLFLLQARRRGRESGWKEREKSGCSDKSSID